MIQQLPDFPRGVATVLLSLILVVSPLLYGSVLPRERLILQLAGFLALAAVLAAGPGFEALRAAAPAVAIAGVGLFGLLQSLPWPIALSVSPAISRTVALMWLGVAAIWAAAGVVGTDRRLRRVLGVAFLVAVVFEIVYGTRQWFEKSSKIWGRPTSGDFERLRGTFVNPDHLAMYLVMALAVCLAWCWWAMRRGQWVSLERRVVYFVLPWSLFVMVFVALAFTGSRAGLVGGLMALLAQGLLLGWRRHQWRASLLGLGAVAAGLVSLLYFGWQRGMERWNATSAYEITWNAWLEVYRHSIELWWQSPWTGTGLGTFREAFPRVQPPELGLSWYHAHSDPLELLVTTGLVGPALMLWGLAVLVPRLLHVLRHGHRSEDCAMALAACGVLVGVLAHSTIDFGLTLPTNAVTAAIILGLVCGTRAP